MSEIKSTDNYYQNAQEISDDILIDVQNELLITATTWKNYEKDVTKGMTDRGGSINVRIPQRFNVSDCEVITSIDDVKEKVTSLTITERKKTAANFTTNDLTLYAKKDFRNRFITPMASEIANEVDSFVGQQIANNTAYHVGTAGTSPASWKALAVAGSFMNKLALRKKPRWMGLSNDDYLESMSSGTLQNAASNQKISKDITRDGQLGMINGMQTYESVYIGTQAAGVGDNVSVPSGGYVAAGLVNGAVGDGFTIVVDGLVDATQAFNQYDKIYIEGVYSVNPTSTKKITGKYMQFTITNDPGTTGTSRTLTVSPEIIASSVDPFRNVSNAIPNDAKVFLATAATTAAELNTPYSVNACYVPEGILFAAPPLILPRTVKFGSVSTDPSTGISLRMIEDYDVITDKVITRVDVIFGMKVLPSRVVGLLGASDLGI